MGILGLILLLVAALGLVIACAYLSYLTNKRRREEMARFAAELGWSFDPDNDPSHDERFGQFEIFRRGHSRAAYNTLTGNLELGNFAAPARMGDFTYKITSSNGKTTTTATYRFSYMIVQPPLGNVPNLLIRPEGLLDKLAGALGFDDIDFESAEFSKRFFVKSADRRFAYDVVHPRMMEFLLQTSPPVVDLEGGQCCVSDGQKRWAPAEFRSQLDWVRAFFELWPGHLTESLNRPSGSPDRVP